MKLELTKNEGNDKNQELKNQLKNILSKNPSIRKISFSSPKDTKELNSKYAM